MTSNATHALVAGMIIAFSAFLLYVTRPIGGGLDPTAGTLCGTLLGGVVAFYFQQAANGQGAAISAAATTAALASSVGQPTSIQSGSNIVKTGTATDLGSGQPQSGARA